jgi:hypothetical protein
VGFFCLFVRWARAPDDGCLLIIGEPIVEPEVDLTAFLARQRLQDEEEIDNVILSGPKAVADEAELADIDHSLAHIGTGKTASSAVRDGKGKAQVVAWDQELEDMRREKDVADAQRGYCHNLENDKREFTYNYGGIQN